VQFRQAKARPMERARPWRLVLERDTVRITRSLQVKTKLKTGNSDSGDVGTSQTVPDPPRS